MGWVFPSMWRSTHLHCEDGAAVKQKKCRCIFILISHSAVGKHPYYSLQVCFRIVFILLKSFHWLLLFCFIWSHRYLENRPQSVVYSAGFQEVSSSLPELFSWHPSKAPQGVSLRLIRNPLTCSGVFWYFEAVGKKTDAGIDRDCWIRLDQQLLNSAEILWKTLFSSHSSRFSFVCPASKLMENSVWAINPLWTLKCPVSNQKIKFQIQRKKQFDDDQLVL